MTGREPRALPGHQRNAGKALHFPPTESPMSATATQPPPPAASTAGLVAPATLQGWLRDGNATLIDVREPEEFAREHIAGARSIPLARISPDAIPPGTRAVLHCKSGRRSAEAKARLAAAGLPGILQLQGGIEAWKSAGLPVEAAPHVPISIMRQVQIVAGSLVAIGTALGAFVSPLALVIPAFMGLGLLFAGVSGTCGLAALLGAMPWNRAFANTCPRA